MIGVYPVRLRRKASIVASSTAAGAGWSGSPTVRKITSWPASRRRTPSQWTRQAPVSSPAMRSTNGEKRTILLSIADCRAGRAAGVAGTVEPAVGDLDQFDGTPWPLLDELVTHPGQFRRRLGGEGRALVVDLIGLPLVVEPRCFDRLLRRHAVIDDVENRLEHGRDNSRAARAAENEKDAAILFDQGRGH